MRRLVRLSKASAKLYGEVRAAMLGAAISFYAIFSLAPIAVIAVAVAGLILEDAVVRAEIEAYVAQELGEEPARLVGDMMRRAASPGTGGIIASISSVILLLYASSRLFHQLQKAFNQIWGQTPTTEKALKRKVARVIEKRLLSFALVLFMGVLLLASVVLSAIVSAAGAEAERWIRFPSAITRSFEVLIIGLLLASAFTLLFKVMPDVRVSWRAALNGGILAAILFSIGRVALGAYFGHGAVASEYGAASALVVVILWIYYSAQVVFLGAVFSRACTEDRRRHPAMEVEPRWRFVDPPAWQRKQNDHRPGKMPLAPRSRRARDH